jgi:preprotein translocase subunit YajC
MFISPAFAQDAAAATTSSGPSTLMTMLPLLIIFVLFYLLVIRPQSKRMREHGELLKQLKAGDKVVTGGGLYGKIISVDDKDMTIEIAPGVNVKAQKHTVSALQETPAAEIKTVK